MIKKVLLPQYIFILFLPFFSPAHNDEDFETALFNLNQLRKKIVCLQGQNKIWNSFFNITQLPQILVCNIPTPFPNIFNVLFDTEKLGTKNYKGRKKDFKNVDFNKVEVSIPFYTKHHSLRYEAEQGYYVQTTPIFHEIGEKGYKDLNRLKIFKNNQALYENSEKTTHIESPALYFDVPLIDYKYDWETHLLNPKVYHGFYREIVQKKERTCWSKEKEYKEMQKFNYVFQCYLQRDKAKYKDTPFDKWYFKWEFNHWNSKVKYKTLIRNRNQYSRWQFFSNLFNYFERYSNYYSYHKQFTCRHSNRIIREYEQKEKEAADNDKKQYTEIKDTLISIQKEYVKLINFYPNSPRALHLTLKSYRRKNQKKYKDAFADINRAFRADEL